MSLKLLGRTMPSCGCSRVAKVLTGPLTCTDIHLFLVCTCFGKMSPGTDLPCTNSFELKANEPAPAVHAPLLGADGASVEMICGALLNQASGFIRLKKFGEAEARCSRLLAYTTPSDGVKVTGGATARTRALHFRGFAR